jgi:hypothetical protein
VTSDVLDEALLRSVVEHLAPESPGLLKVQLRDGAEVGDGGADELLVVGDGVGLGGEGERCDGRLVVGASSLGEEAGGSTPLEVDGRVEGSVDGEVGVVGAEAVALRVGVREEARLKNGVGGRLDSLDEVRGRECDLLDLLCGGSQSQV